MTADRFAVSVFGVSDHTKLLVWKRAHAVALEANRLAVSIRSRNYTPLKNQIIRAAMSVPANIVEGRAQKGEREFSRFLRYAAASAAELEYHLQLAHELGVVHPKQCALLRDDLAAPGECCAPFLIV